MSLRAGATTAITAVLLLAVVVVTGVVLHNSSSAEARSTAQRCRLYAEQSRARARIVTGHGQVVAVIGDSYSVGRGLAHPTQAWPHELSGRLHVLGFSGSGFSRTASPCQHVAYYQRAGAALAAHPALVVVEGGLNDVGQPVGRVRAGFHRLMTELAGYRVVVVGPADAPRRAAGARKVDALLRAECDRWHTPYVPMIGRRFDYLPDRLHLTPASHRAFGRDVAAALGRS
jgi:acyl-CoA thioesterase-1